MTAFTAVGYSVPDVNTLRSIPSEDLMEGAALLLADDGAGNRVWVQYNQSATSGDYRPNDAPTTGWWSRVGRMMTTTLMAGSSNATVNTVHLVDTSGGVANVYLPDIPLIGDICKFVDKAGTDPSSPTGFGANSLTIHGVGALIQGQPTLTLNEENSSASLIFNGSQWNISQLFQSISQYTASNLQSQIDSINAALANKASLDVVNQFTAHQWVERVIVPVVSNEHTIDLSQGNFFQISVTGTCTLNAPTNRPGDVAFIVRVKISTFGGTLQFDNVFRSPDGEPLNVTSPTQATFYLSCFVDHSSNRIDTVVVGGTTGFKNVS